MIFENGSDLKKRFIFSKNIFENVQNVNVQIFKMIQILKWPTWFKIQNIHILIKGSYLKLSKFEKFGRRMKKQHDQNVAW